MSGRHDCSRKISNRIGDLNLTNLEIESMDRKRKAPHEIKSQPLLDEKTGSSSHHGLYSKRSRDVCSFCGDEYIEEKPSLHEYRVRITKSDQNENDQTNQPSAKRSRSVDFRFACQLNDVWEFEREPVPTSRSRTRLSQQQQPVSTGSSFTDKILLSLEMQGYRMVENIAQGRFTSCLLARSLPNVCRSRYPPYVVVKFFVKCVKRKLRKCTRDLTSPWSLDVPDELLLQETLEHPNVLRLHEYHVWNGRLAAVLDYCEVGSLAKLLRFNRPINSNAKPVNETTASQNLSPGDFLAEPVARRYFRQIVAAVEYIHSCGVTHRNIQPSNVLISGDETVKLADFGAARRFTVGDAPLQPDTPCSMSRRSPELLRVTPYDPRRLDVWQLSLLLYQMTTGRPAFTPGNDSVRDKRDAAATQLCVSPEQRNMAQRAALLVEIGRGMQLPSGGHYSNELALLLRGSLNVSTVDRFTLNRIRNSDWFVVCDDKVSIGSFYLFKEPHKHASSAAEQQLKREFKI